jgi:hypothetical protein
MTFLAGDTPAALGRASVPAAPVAMYPEIGPGGVIPNPDTLDTGDGAASSGSSPSVPAGSARRTGLARA